LRGCFHIAPHVFWKERFWLDGITFVNAHLIVLAKSIAEGTSANLPTFMRSLNRR
jgi:hypothetical protein